MVWRMMPQGMRADAHGRGEGAGRYGVVRKQLLAMPSPSIQQVIMLVIPAVLTSTVGLAVEVWRVSLLQTGRTRTAASNREESVCKEMIAFCSWLHREHPTQQAQVQHLPRLTGSEHGIYYIGLYRILFPCSLLASFTPSHLLL